MEKEIDFSLGSLYSANGFAKIRTNNIGYHRQCDVHVLGSRRSMSDGWIEFAGFHVSLLLFVDLLPFGW